jgi:hypothetical protein
MKLPKNINTSGRWLRGIIGVLLLVMALWKMSWILLIAGAFTLFEAMMSWCVVYHILGKSSCPIKKK